MILAFVASLCVLALLSAPSLAAGNTNEGECPNEQLRVENDSTDLPDCRAYEMVTPPDKATRRGPALPYAAGFDALPGVPSDDGSKFLLDLSYGLLGDEPSSFADDYTLIGRTSAGWAAHTLMTAQDYRTSCMSRGLCHRPGRGGQSPPSESIASAIAA